MLLLAIISTLLLGAFCRDLIRYQIKDDDVKSSEQGLFIALALIFFSFPVITIWLFYARIAP